MLRIAGLADLNGGMAEVFLSVSTVFAETICTRGVKKEDKQAAAQRSVQL